MAGPPKPSKAKPSRSSGPRQRSSSAHAAGGSSSGSETGASGPPASHQHLAPDALEQDALVGHVLVEEEDLLAERRGRRTCPAPDRARARRAGASPIRRGAKERRLLGDATGERTAWPLASVVSAASGPSPPARDVDVRHHRRAAERCLGRRSHQSRRSAGDDGSAPTPSLDARSRPRRSRAP
jgi:hypothetical protein